MHQLDQSKGQECRRPRHTWHAQGVGSICACLTRPLQKRHQRHARNRHRQRMTSAAPPRQMKVGGDIKVSAPCTLGQKERSMAGKHAVQVSQATCLRVNCQVEMAWKMAWQASPKSPTVSNSMLTDERTSSKEKKSTTILVLDQNSSGVKLRYMVSLYINREAQTMPNKCTAMQRQMQCRRMMP